jgi:FtsP/CotA-like multicopper oxidase with cupredoxin domain
LIGVDGGGIPRPVVAEEVLLAPGERIDALVKADRAGGAYRLLNLPYQRATMGMMGMGPTAAVPMTVATVIYQGEAGQDLHVPSAVVQVDPLPGSGLPVRRFVLGGAGMGMGGRGMSFLINGRTFDHRRVDTRVELGTIEDWEIVNATTMDHPFHLHTNPFQVVDAGGQAEPAWKDVVQVPAGQRRRIRVRFADYAGKSVYHCHILDHEDLGMMGVIETVA